MDLLQRFANVCKIIWLVNLMQAFLYEMEAASHEVWCVVVSVEIM